MKSFFITDICIEDPQTQEKQTSVFMDQIWVPDIYHQFSSLVQDSLFPFS